MHINRPYTQMSLFIKTTTVLRLFLLHNHPPLNVHLAIQTQHHANGCAAYRASMVQGCDSVPATEAKMPAWHQSHTFKWLKQADFTAIRSVSTSGEHSQQLIVNSQDDLECGVEVDFFGDLQHVKLLCRSEQQCCCIGHINIPKTHCTHLPQQRKAVAAKCRT